MACRSDGLRQLRALVCQTFGGYDFGKLEGLTADEIAEVAGAALWLKDEEAKAVKQTRGKGKRR